MEKDLSYKEMYKKFHKSYYSSIKSYLEILEDNINDNKRYYDGQRLYVVFPEKQQ